MQEVFESENLRPCDIREIKFNLEHVELEN